MPACANSPQCSGGNANEQKDDGRSFTARIMEDSILPPGNPDEEYGLNIPDP